MVENTIIRLFINDNEYFQIEIPSSLEIFGFHDVLIAFYDKDGTRYVLCDDILEISLELLRLYLQRAINNQLALDSSIIPGSHKRDLGYLWDVYCSRIFSEESDEYPDRKKQDIEGFVNKGLPDEEHLVFEETKDGKRDWVGMRYYMWSSVGDLPDIWLYNRDGNICLEITPTYKWHTRDPKENEMFIPHEEFARNYKPLVITEITQEAAHSLLIKVQELLETIKENDRKCLNAMKTA
jgi:hypothetical protein